MPEASPQPRAFQICQIAVQAIFTLAELAAFIGVQYMTMSDDKVKFFWNCITGGNTSAPVMVTFTSSSGSNVTATTPTPQICPTNNVSITSAPIITVNNTGSVNGTTMNPTTQASPLNSSYPVTQDFWKIVTMDFWAELVLVVIAVIQLLIAFANLCVNRSQDGAVPAGGQAAKSGKLVGCFNCVACLVSIGAYITLIIALVWGGQFYNAYFPYQSIYPNVVQRMKEQVGLCVAFIILAIVPIVLTILLCLCGMGMGVAIMACCICCKPKGNSGSGGAA